MTRVIKSVFYYIIILVLLLFIISNLAGRSKAVYNLTNVCSYTVLTGSMRPEINPGDVIIVKKINIEDVNSGDIITFNKDSEVITHRAIEAKDNGIVTKGDNNNVLDSGQVTSTSLIGRVILIVPKIGYVFHPAYNILVVSIIMIMGGLYTLVKFIKK